MQQECQDQVLSKPAEKECLLCAIFEEGGVADAEKSCSTPASSVLSPLIWTRTAQTRRLQ